MQQLEAGELPVNKIFSSDFEFEIPDYQRPYAWTSEEALQLLDDFDDALSRQGQEPYFLGSIVLVKDKGAPRAQIIDGQQRTTTLTILLAVLRDLTSNTKLADELAERIQEPGSIMQGTQAKPRLTLRKRDAGFFHSYVQRPGQIAQLVDLGDHALKTDAQKSIRGNARALRQRLERWSEEKRLRLAAMIGARTFLVVVSTPDLASAHRIFSVMNARGLDLSAADIFKSQVIGSVPDADQEEYADKWETAEVDLGRAAFADLFLHVRMIFAKVRGQRELLKEFEEQVLRQYASTPREFVDDVLLPYAEAFGFVLGENYQAGPGSDEVNLWLKRLNQLDNNDWRPAALWALKHHGDDPTYVASFLRRLERLAASMLLRRVYATPRALRYADLLRQLERGNGLGADAFDLQPDEVAATRSRLEGEIYLVAPVRKYVLLRLDEHLAGKPGVSYEHKIITVEHVLPQHPKSGSRWIQDFSAGEREYWTHRLANLVLLSRNKNSKAQNYEFDVKKATYFTDGKGVAVFALTMPVLNTPTWTPQVLRQRQDQLVTELATMWELV